MTHSQEIFDYTSLPTLTRTSCPACGAPSRRGVPVRDLYGYTVSITGCSCGLDYLSDPMTRDGYATFYSGEGSPYRRLVWNRTHPHDPYDVRKDQHNLFITQWGYGRDLKHWLLRQGLPLHKVSTVLDVGGSTGLVAEQIAPHAQIIVLDPSPSELSLAHQQGFTSIHGWIEDPLQLAAPPDLILCCESLDHFTEPYTALVHMRDVAHPKTRLYVDYSHHPYVKIDHPTLWEERSFLAVLERAGWQVLARRRGRGHSGALCKPRL